MIQRPHQTDRELALRKYFEIVTKPSIEKPALFAAGGILLASICLIQYYQRSESDPSSTSGIVFLLILGLIIAAIGGVAAGSAQTRYLAALRDIQPQPSDS